MLIRWLRSRLGVDEVYIVLDGARIVDVSSSLQGAELLRAGEATRLAFDQHRLGQGDPDYRRRVECSRRYFYDRMAVANRRVQDVA